MLSLIPSSYTRSGHQWQRFLLPVCLALALLLLPSSQTWNSYIILFVVFEIVYVFLLHREINVFDAFFWFGLWLGLAIFFSSFAFSLLPPSPSLIVWLFALVFVYPLTRLSVWHYGVSFLVILITAVLFCHAQWGIAQFLLQHDLGLQYLGESRIGPQMSVVAKFSVMGTPVVRSYGPYAHANPFGGVMLLGVLLLSYYRSLWGRFFWPLLLVFGAAVLLSFSRSALLGLVLLLLPLCGVSRPSRRFLASGLIILFAVSPFLLARFTDSADVAWDERLVGYQWAVALMQDSILWRGAGVGNYPVVLGDYLAEHAIVHQSWQVDFVHSVPLLLVAEWGLFAAAVFFACLLFLGLQIGGKSVWFIPLVPSLLLDHYWVTQFAPAVLLALVLLILFQQARSDHDY